MSDTCRFLNFSSDLLLDEVVSGVKKTPLDVVHLFLFNAEDQSSLVI